MTVIDRPLDETGRRLVNLLQAEFPLTPTPFADLGVRLGLDGDEVIERVEALRMQGIVRIIGPVFNSRSLGYHSTLVAMRVPEERVEEAVLVINAHPGVGHNYQRDHFYNLWLTLAVRDEPDLSATLQGFEERIRPEALLELPVVRLFKIRLFFDLEDRGNHDEDGMSPAQPGGPLPLSDEDRAVINAVQRQLPATARPFDPIAREIAMDTDAFLDCCRNLRERGIMRRFGASIEHRRAGFVANAMICWKVPPEAVEEVGRKMAACREVTHCYERRTGPLWPEYNMFTMVHGRTPAENEEAVRRMARETGIGDYRVLQTVREFKKERVKYRV